MVNNGKGLAGKISNSGVQEVKAIHQAPSKAGKSVVKKGGDLRTGKSSK